ncbi:hypothetical protein [Catellatospora tritici]|uniref:hypothetical protein n=1 Tax=Catellatospora tritici TaxID=2851566 RepID=UPI001C2DE2E2|nr:hypothetical protein [Catellatospora tritici]MBV1855549.1 hypothetical protein [Catellatospora tritici]
MTRAAAGLSVIALLAVAVPAHAGDVAQVHSWMTGAKTAVAGGEPVEFRLNFTQSGGTYFVYAQSIAIDIVPPAGAKANTAAVEYQYFTDWNPLPLSPMELATESVAFRNLRVKFSPTAVGGDWRLRARITDYDWSIHGEIQTGAGGEVVEQSDWFTITVAGTSPPAKTAAPAPSKPKTPGSTHPATPAASGIAAIPSPSDTGGDPAVEASPIASADQVGQVKASDSGPSGLGYVALGVGLAVVFGAGGLFVVRRRQGRV